jgi:hypothetical protein
MKSKYNALTTILFFSLFTFTVYSQDQQNGTIDIEINITENEIQNSDSNISVVVSVISDNPPYVYQVFDALPWDGGNEILNSQPQYSSEFVFEDLKEGSYFICVTDHVNNTDCELIKIK